MECFRSLVLWRSVRALSLLTPGQAGAVDFGPVNGTWEGRLDVSGPRVSRGMQKSGSKLKKIKHAHTASGAGGDGRVTSRRSSAKKTLTTIRWRSADVATD